jgi:hypothetical protein
MLTFRGAFEADVELLHVVVDQGNFIVAHHHLHHVCLYPTLWAAHLADRPSRFVGLARGRGVRSMFSRVRADTVRFLVLVGWYL